jgi:hypothetical protein
MRRRRLYLDSSVLGWSLNRGNPSRHSEANRLLRQIAAGHFVGAYSWVMEDEINDAPKRIRDRLWRKVRTARLRKVDRRLRTDAQVLGETYCSREIVPRAYLDDAIHIAIATLWKADALVSYNFQHIVNLDTMLAVNQLNVELGLNELFLCQPQEVIIHDVL